MFLWTMPLSKVTFFSVDLTLTVSKRVRLQRILKSDPVVSFPLRQIYDVSAIFQAQVNGLLTDPDWNLSTCET
jgi:hypothetical protein